MKYLIHLLSILLFISCTTNKKKTKKEELKVAEVKEVFQKNKEVNGSNIIYDSIWRDALGNNIFKITKAENHDYQSEINIKMKFSLLNDEGKVELIDSIFDCPVEYHMDLIKKSIKLIDNNDNNIKELLFAYSYTCRGDMIGDTLKVVAIEGNKIWSIKGLRTNLMDEQIANFENKKISGFGNINENTMPKFLKDIATKLWLKHSNEEIVKSDMEVEKYYKLINEK